MALLACGSSHADFVWDGDGGDDLMSNDLNWVGGTAPAGDVGGDTFIFGPAGIGTLTPDVGANDFTNLGGLSFEAGALGAYLISDPGVLGGSFSFTADTGFIENTSSFLQTIDVDLVGTGTGADGRRRFGCGETSLTIHGRAAHRRSVGKGSSAARASRQAARGHASSAHSGWRAARRRWRMPRSSTMKM